MSAIRLSIAALALMGVGLAFAAARRHDRHVPAGAPTPPRERTFVVQPGPHLGRPAPEAPAADSIDIRPESGTASIQTHGDGGHVCDARGFLALERHGQAFRIDWDHGCYARAACDGADLVVTSVSSTECEWQACGRTERAGLIGHRFANACHQGTPIDDYVVAAGDFARAIEVVEWNGDEWQPYDAKNELTIDFRSGDVSVSTYADNHHSCAFDGRIARMIDGDTGLRVEFDLYDDLRCQATFRCRGPNLALESVEPRACERESCGTRASLTGWTWDACAPRRDTSRPAPLLRWAWRLERAARAFVQIDRE